MSVANLLALGQRAATLPMALLDRIDAGLDSGFTWVDGKAQRKIHRFARQIDVVAWALTRAIRAFDRALTQRVSNFDATYESFATKVSNTRNFIASHTFAIEAHIDTNLDRRIHNSDRAIAAVALTAVSTVGHSIALVSRIDSKITRIFNRVDSEVNNLVFRAHNHRLSFLSLIYKLTSAIDKRIETDYLRVDGSFDAGINFVAESIATTLSRATTFTIATDIRLSNALKAIDASVDRHKMQGNTTAAAKFKLVNAKVLTFERFLDLGISRTDSQITKASYSFNRSTKFLANQVTVTDLKLNQIVTTWDAHAVTGAQKLVTAAVGISNLAVDKIKIADSSLSNQVSRIDTRVDAFIDLTHGQRQGSTNRPTSSLPLAATGLTLVIGTLGAATGASVVSASPVPPELDNSVVIETSAAKDAVTQYLSVRESFLAAQSSRSRKIQTLEQEIAAMQARMNQDKLDGNAVIEIADNYSGVPYVRGGTTPKGFDCSGYTSYVFAQLGVDLPRTSASQYAWADKVKAEDRQVGDLMFWSDRGGIHHVAIYAGDGKMWDSPRPGRRVGKVNIWGSPTYGRVPVKEINASALEEIAAMTAALEEIRSQSPSLEIVIDPQHLSSNSN